ncbi:ephrin type-B receptor 2-like protein [Camelus ferus]|nr:ephrin type-B receptor 2-like protein [Camelus ferus]
MVRKDWASQNSIALSWQAPAFSNGAILDYEIKYYEKEHEQLTYSSTRSKAPSVIITGLKPATKYIFHIRVRTATGYSGYSQKFEFETGDENQEIQLTFNKYDSFEYYIIKSEMYSQTNL